MNDYLEMDLNILQGLADRLRKQAAMAEQTASDIPLAETEPRTMALTESVILRVLANLVLDEANSREPE